MIELLPLIVLFLSGFATVAFGFFKVGKYGAIISTMSFVPLLFLKSHFLKLSWFNISSLEFGFSFDFRETEILLCLLITAILVCLYLARSISFFDDSIERKFGILNIFIAFMCCAILSSNIFQFYMSIEALGLISTILVSVEKNSNTEATRVFLFNKFASLIFLVATMILAIEVKSFDVAAVKNACCSKDSAKLFLPACLLLVSCFCKGAQLPFSYWLLDAVKANTFASILIHAGTIVAVGIIFIARFYFLFDCFPILKEIMVAVGLYTSFWMACCALAHNNIKKIIACLTSSSAGLMFMACGLGGYSLAILYFVCHAFFKSMLFLSFAYLIAAMSGEKNLNHLGGIASLAPKVTDIIWTAFLFASGFPFLAGFFSKISFMGTLDISDMGFLSAGIVSVSMISVAAIFRMLFRSLYGKTNSDELTLSRSSKSNTYDMKPFWLLACISIFGSFTIWSIFEWGDLHFGHAGIVYIRESKDYLADSINSMLQLAISVLLVLFFEKYINNVRRNEIGLVISLFRRHEIYAYCCDSLKTILTYVMSKFDKVQRNLAYITNIDSFKAVYNSGTFLVKNHRSFLQSHAMWILFGITLVLALTLFEGMF